METEAISEVSASHDMKVMEIKSFLHINIDLK